MEPVSQIPPTHSPPLVHVPTSQRSSCRDMGAPSPIFLLPSSVSETFERYIFDNTYYHLSISTQTTQGLLENPLDRGSLGSPAYNILASSPKNPVMTSNMINSTRNSTRAGASPSLPLGPRTGGGVQKTRAPIKDRRSSSLEDVIAVQDIIPYHQYRSRLRKEENTQGESVWDDQMEAAFMEG
jgi:hypothetical protein